MDIDLVSVFIAVAVLSALGYLMLKDSSKKVNAEMLGIVAVGFVILAIVAAMGWFGTTTIQTTTPYQPGTPGYTTPSVQPGDGVTTIITDGVPRPIDSLTILLKEESSNKWDQVEDQVAWYEEDSDPRLSTSYTLDTTTIATGNGTDTSMLLESNTKYFGIFHDTSTAPNPTYYDGVLGMGVWDITTVPIAYAIETAGTTDSEASAIVKFGTASTAAIWKIATIPDLIDESDITGKINDKTSTATIAGGLTATGNWNSTNEIQIGADNTPADDDTVYYNDTNGDGTFTLELTFGADGSDAFLKRPVLCFSNDRDNPCEGTEFSKITATQESGAAGSEVQVPNDLTPYFKEMPACVEIGGQTMDGVVYIGSGYKATYTLTFTVQEDYTDGSADVFYMTPDDLGGYNAHDLISTGQGADPSASDLKFSFRA